MPHEIAGIPLFGFGLLLGLLVAAWVGWGLWNALNQRPLSEVSAALPVFGIAALIVTFLFPAIEQTWPDGTPIGLPIRGYGVLVLLGLVSGIALTVTRGRQVGVHADTIVGLGFWMMLTGVLGARVFYVIQKWESFNSVGEIFQLTEGGLVIYGGVIGGVLAGGIYCWRKGLKIAAMGDLVAPGFLLGQAFGRIGCLLHGCCFGGICEAQLPALQFPVGSGPYQAQLVSGRLLGLHVESGDLPQAILAVDAESVAARVGIEVGDRLERIAFEEYPAKPGSDPTAPAQLYVEATVNGKVHPFRPAALPDKSLPTHPSQIYSAINALLLCLLVWSLQPLPKRDGVTFCTAILLYVGSRFLMEWVRTDEAGQFGTGLTIAQLVSLVAAGLMLACLFYLRSGPEGRCWDWSGRAVAP